MSSTILLVDDEKDILVALKELLEMEGYKIICASNGEEGVKKFREFTPDLIISDMMMPILNGNEMIKLIRDNATYPKVPIIMMSSVTALSKIENPSWDAFIRKPSGIDNILNVIKKLLNK